MIGQNCTFSLPEVNSVDIIGKKRKDREGDKKCAVN